MRTLLSIIVLLAAVISCPAKPKLESFVTDKNLSTNDLIRFFIQKRVPDLQAEKLTDADLDSAVFTKLVSLAATDLIEYGFDTEKVYTLEEAQAKVDAIDAAGMKMPFGVKLREKWQDLKYTDPGDQEAETTDFSKAKGASLSFSHNFLDDSSQWSIRGAIFKDFALGDSSALVPSITLDRVKSPDVKKSVDSLVGRVALVKYLDEYHHTIRTGALWATDTRFRSAQVGGELEWEPTFIHSGIGALHGFPGAANLLMYRATFFVHFEGGDVLDQGTNPKLIENEAFFRVGPFAELTLIPVAFPRFSLFVRWQDYESFASDAIATRLFTTGCSYAFDKEEHVTLDLKYYKGRQALTAEKQDNVELSLGLKF